jgi:hypothetical protein
MQKSVPDHLNILLMNVEAFSTKNGSIGAMMFFLTDILKVLLLLMKPLALKTKKLKELKVF